MIERSLSLIDGNGSDLGQGAVVALVSVALVFLILAIIITVTYLIGLAVKKYSSKKEKPVSPDDAPAEIFEGIDTDDEDMVAAVLVASIDYRQECGKNVKVVSVKEIH